MPSLTQDQFGNPIWVQDDPLAPPPVPDLLGAADAPAGAPQVGIDPVAEQAARALQAINADLAPGRGPAVGNQVPEGSPYAAAPEDPYARPPGAATVDRQFNKTGQQIAGTIAKPGELGGPDVPVQPYVSPETQARRDEDTALNQAALSKVQAADAQLIAQHDLAMRRAEVQTKHAEAQAASDAVYQQARMAARADADRETSQLLAEIDKKAKEEPVNTRYWENASDFGKALWIISLAFGTLGAAKAPGVKNLGLQMLMGEVDKDVQNQKERLARELQAAKDKGEVLTRRQRERMQDLGDDHAMAIAKLTGLRDAALEKANAPGPADQKAAYAQGAAWADEQRVIRAAKYSDQLYQSKERLLDRQAENSRAYLADRRARDIAAASQAYDYYKLGVDTMSKYDLAELSAEAKYNKGKGTTGPFKPEDVRSIPTQTGIRVVDDSNGGKPVGDGALRITKENETEARNLAKAAQEKWKALSVVEQELGKGSLVLKDNPRLESAIITLGYRESKDLDPRAITTDKDLAAAMRASFGADLDSTTGRLAVSAPVVGASLENIKKYVQESKRNLPKNVSNGLTSLVETQLPGYDNPHLRVDWTPNDLLVDEPAAPNSSQIDASYGKSTPLPKLESTNDLRKAEALQSQGVPALPDYRGEVRDPVTKKVTREASQPIVEKAIADFKNATPSQIRERAAVARERVKGDQRAELKIQAEADDAAKKAARALEDLKDQVKFTEIQGRAHDQGARLPGTKPRTDVDRVEQVAKMAKQEGLGQLSADEILKLIKDVDAELNK